MRVVVQNAPEHPDNQGFIISHIGMNNDARWDEFRELDLDDQALIRDWLTGEPVGDEPEGEGEARPRRFDQGLLVNDEIIGRFLDQAYLDPEDDRVLDELLARTIGAGLTLGDLVDREQLRAKLREEHEMLKAEGPQAIPISPQKRRRATRDRLAQRTNSVVSRVLNDLQLSRNGREVAKALPRCGMVANVQAVTRQINGAINEALGIKSGKRGELRADQTQVAYEQLDDIGDQVRDRIKRAMKEKG